jgi:hypothetical protein
VKFILAFIAALIIAPAFGQQGSTSVDPFALRPVQGITMAIGTGARALCSSQTLNPAVRNLVIITAGQSNGQDIAPSAYSPVNPTKLSNFSVYTGASYCPAQDPLLGTQFGPGPGAGGIGNIYLKIADDLVTANLFDQVTIVPINVGGTSFAMWDPTSPLGTFSDRIPVALARLAARGIAPGANVTFVILMMQGETDCINGTSQAAATTSINNIITASRNSGFTGTWFVAEESWTGATTCAAIQAAEAAVVNHSAGVWAGPNIDALVGTICSGGADCRQPGGLHLSDAGQVAGAGSPSGWQAALHLFGPPF